MAFIVHGVVFAVVWYFVEGEFIFKKENNKAPSDSQPEETQPLPIRSGRGGNRGSAGGNGRRSNVFACGGFFSSASSGDRVIAGKAEKKSYRTGRCCYDRRDCF